MKEFEVYTARYCGTCRALKRRLSDLKDHLSDLKITYRDIDVERDKARRNLIDGVPTLIVYQEGVEVERISGSIYEEDILRLIGKE
jgi:thioredoxin 1